MLKVHICICAARSFWSKIIIGTFDAASHSYLLINVIERLLNNSDTNPQINRVKRIQVIP